MSSPKNLKPENILINITQNKTLKAFVADKGTAINCESDGSKAKATAFWAAPELKEINENSSQSAPLDLSKSDVFTLGLLTLFCLDYNRFITNQSDHKNILNQNESELLSYLDTIALKLPQAFFNILRCMLSYNISNRPSIEQLLLNDFDEIETCIKSRLETR